MNISTIRENQLEIRRLIKAPRPRVFATWTDPDELMNWFGPEQVTCLSAKVDLRVGGEWHLRMKSEYAGETNYSGAYREVKPPARLVYTWTWKNHPLMGSGETLVTVDFVEANGWTEVRLRHEGFENVEVRDRHAQGWPGCFDKLERYLNAPSSQDDVTGLKLVITREFNAPRELVWQAWTDPEKLKLWFKPADHLTIHSLKANVCIGGKYRIQMKRSDGEFYTAVGTYREIKAPERLVFTWAWEKDGSEADFGEVEPNETVVALEFRARGKKTELVLTQEKFASVESRDGHQHGWKGCFEQLNKLIEKLKDGPVIKAGSAKDYLGQEFVITREFNAPRAAVFQAWTDPKQLAQWWGPRGFTNPVCDWDARPGAKIYVVMRAPNGMEHHMGGEFREVVAPERLVFTSGALDEKGNLLFEFLHAATFTEQNGKTKFTLVSRVTKTTAEANKYIGGFEAGMTQSLERLAVLVQEVEPLAIERSIDAPVARVWQALTTKEELRRWFFELAEFKAEPGFKFRFAVLHEGFNYDHHCKVMAAIPNQKLAFTWRYEGYAGDSLVTIELFAEGSRTRVKLTHTGLATFPAIPAFARKNFMRGWTQIIGSALGDFVENADREIVISREFDAPRELVWEAWTNPKHVVNWWGPRGFTTTIEEMDVRPGGVWKHVMHGPDGANYPNKSVFKEVVKPERIVFSHGGGREGGPGAHFAATWTFDALPTGKTQVTIRLVFPSAADRDFVIKEFGAIEGGQQTLERLGEHLAGTLSKQPTQ